MTTWNPFTEPTLLLLTEALLHFVWQGTAILMLLIAALWIVGFRRAAVRYRLLLLGLAMMAVCPPATFCGLLAIRETPEVSSLDPVQEDSAAGVSSASVAAQFWAEAPDRVEAVSPNASSAADDHPAWLQRAQPQLLVCWLLGVALLSSRMASGWLGARWLVHQSCPAPAQLKAQLARLAERLDMSGTPSIRISVRIREAMVVGLLRPVVLVPSAWLAQTPADVWESVLLHELAHIRRRDLWVNVLQRLVETLLF